jgi:hypothetical protein
VKEYRFLYETRGQKNILTWHLYDSEHQPYKLVTDFGRNHMALKGKPVTGIVRPFTAEQTLEFLVRPLLELARNIKDLELRGNQGLLSRVQKRFQCMANLLILPPVIAILKGHNNLLCFREPFYSKESLIRRDLGNLNRGIVCVRKVKDLNHCIISSVYITRKSFKFNLEKIEV